MNNKGKSNNLINIYYRIKNSYICRFISKIISTFLTIILICMLIIGGLMFYYNRRANTYNSDGTKYEAPFGLYTIVSGSMEPNVSVYDVVAVTDVKDLSKIRAGDVITFISTWELNYGVTVTHRVVDINKNSDGEYELTTKGDNNNQEDGATVTSKNLVGKVIFKIPQLGRLQFFLATKMGWFIVVFVPALGIVIYDVFKIIKLMLIKEKIENVADVKDIDKIYYGDELLDNRSLTPDAMEKTTVINYKTIEKAEGRVTATQNKTRLKVEKRSASTAIERASSNNKIDEMKQIKSRKTKTRTEVKKTRKVSSVRENTKNRRKPTESKE